MAKANLSVPEELRKRILFTLGILVIYRLGVHVPTPGVDANAVFEFFQNQKQQAQKIVNPQVDNGAFL